MGTIAGNVTITESGTYQDYTFLGTVTVTNGALVKFERCKFTNALIFR